MKSFGCFGRRRYRCSSSTPRTQTRPLRASAPRCCSPLALPVLQPCQLPCSDRLACFPGSQFGQLTWSSIPILQALASCEALLHPRAAPLFPSQPAASAAAAAAAAGQPVAPSAWAAAPPEAVGLPPAAQAAPLMQSAGQGVAPMQAALAGVAGAAGAAAAPAPGDIEMTDAANSAEATAEAQAANPVLLQPLPAAPAAAKPAQMPRQQQANGGIDAGRVASSTPLPAPSEPAMPTNGNTTAAAPSAGAAPGGSPAPDALAKRPADTAAAPAALDGSVAAATPAFAGEQYSSDSEGSLPEIDSGPSDGGSGSDEEMDA